MMRILLLILLLQLQRQLWLLHHRSGRGYRLLADQVVQLDQLNPQVAARMVGAFNAWRRFDEQRQTMICSELERIGAIEGLSKDVYEIVARNLGWGG